jgi:acetylglutamate kinase
MQIGRVLLLHIEGGIHQDGIGLDLLTFGEESNKLLDACQLDELQQQLLQAAETLQRLSAIELRISVTSPLNLLEELFTTKGKGTLLRRPANIEMYESYEHIQTDRLTALIEEGFGNKLPTHFIERPVSRIYIIDDYKGAAILAATSVGQYLTKFVVSPRYQGEGLGKDLWIRMCAENARLFWRSNPDRPVNEWYAKVCDGMARADNWNVYWKGIMTKEIPSAISVATGMEPDFPDNRCGQRRNRV